jgi:hypothetical protein
MPKMKDGKKVLIRVENLKQYFPVKKDLSSIQSICLLELMKM